MQVFVTLPQELESVPNELVKISKNIYYNQPNSAFYKSVLLDPLVALIGQSLVTRQNIVFTKYDPSFLILQLFACSKEVFMEDIPFYLSPTMLGIFGEIGTHSVRCDKQKILNFLVKRATLLHDHINDKQYSANKMIKLKQSSENTEGRKVISKQAYEILRKDVPEVFMEELMSSRLSMERVMRPIVMDTYEPEVERDPKNKKKTTPKPKPPQLVPKNQQTLFGFMKKS